MIDTFEILEQEIQDNLEPTRKLCPDCGAALWPYDLGYACYSCGARFGVSRFGDLFRSHVQSFRPAG